MNCAPRKRVRNSVPMCCVCDKSSAASISSRIYIGAGLNYNNAMINDSAMSDLFRLCYVNEGKRLGAMLRGTYRWPPLSSVKLCFQTLPSWTLISRPSIKSCLSGGCSFAKFPGRSSAKMPPKSLVTKKSDMRSQEFFARSYPFTFSHVVVKASLLYRSSSSIVCSIFSLSFSTVPSIFFRLASRFSTLVDGSSQ
jgi:hypothetical protein